MRANHRIWSYGLDARWSGLPSLGRWIGLELRDWIVTSTSILAVLVSSL